MTVPAGAAAAAAMISRRTLLLRGSLCPHHRIAVVADAAAAAAAAAASHVRHALRQPPPRQVWMIASNPAAATTTWTTDIAAKPTIAVATMRQLLTIHSHRKPPQQRAWNFSKKQSNEHHRHWRKNAAAAVARTAASSAREGCGMTSYRATTRTRACSTTTTAAVHDTVTSLGIKPRFDFNWLKDESARQAMTRNILQRQTLGADVQRVVDLRQQHTELTKHIRLLRTKKRQNAKAVQQLRNKCRHAASPEFEQHQQDEEEEEEKQQQQQLAGTDEHNMGALVQRGMQLKSTLAETEAEEARIHALLQHESFKIPNWTDPLAPAAQEPVDITHTLCSTSGSGGEKRRYDRQQQHPEEKKLPETPAWCRDHLELGELHDLFDFPAAAKASGSGFVYLKREAALLEMALVQYTMQRLVKEGFTPIAAPDLVHHFVVEGCGFQPRDDAHQHIYHVSGGAGDLCLAGTAELPLCGMFVNSILQDEQVPQRLVAFGHCFRTEAGGTGAASRGIYRMHQFSKVEMFIVCGPEQSSRALDEIVALQRDLFQELELNVRALDMPACELGAPAARKIDFEAWMPGRGSYGEISSASNCTDYQARRLNIRCRSPSVAPAAGACVPSSGKATEAPLGKVASASSSNSGRKKPLVFAHTVNGTACAVPRTLLAMLEQGQRKDGTVHIPQVLRPFIGGHASLPWL